MPKNRKKKSDDWQQCSREKIVLNKMPEGRRNLSFAEITTSMTSIRNGKKEILRHEVTFRPEVSELFCQSVT